MRADSSQVREKQLDTMRFDSFGWLQGKSYVNKRLFCERQFEFSALKAARARVSHSRQSTTCRPPEVSRSKAEVGRWTLARGKQSIFSTVRKGREGKRSLAIRLSSWHKLSEETCLQTKRAILKRCANGINKSGLISEPTTTTTAITTPSTATSTSTRPTTEPEAVI